MCRMFVGLIGFKSPRMARTHRGNFPPSLHQGTLQRIHTSPLATSKNFKLFNMAPSRTDTPEVVTPSDAKSHVQNKSHQRAETGDWRDDFFRDGFVVIKNVIPKERARQYQSDALTWLESFGLGFDREDKGTWKTDNLPQSWKGGMYLHFSAAHEKYMWDIRW